MRSFEVAIGGPDEDPSNCSFSLSCFVAVAGARTKGSEK